MPPEVIISKAEMFDFPYFDFFASDALARESDEPEEIGKGKR